MHKKIQLAALAAGLLLTSVSFGQTTTPASGRKQADPEGSRSAINTLIPSYRGGTPRLNYLGLSVSPEFQYGMLAGQFTPMAGISAMVHINKKFGIGAAAYSTIDERFAPTKLDAAKAIGLSNAYGGLKLEFTPNPDAKVHVSFPLLIGAGIAQVDSVNGQHERDHDYHQGNGLPEIERDDYDNHDGNELNYFVIQPGVNVEVNLIRYAKLFAGVSYRIVPTVSRDKMTGVTTYPTPTTAQLGGVNVSAGLRIGLFNYALRHRKKAKTTE